MIRPDTSVGWIKSHRSILTWEWYNNLPCRTLFQHLLHTVNYEEKKWQGRVILPGQLVTSLTKLADAAGLSLQQTRTALSNLQSTRDLTYEATTQYTIITITNWAVYQEVNIPITNEQQTSNIRITTTKEVKKERKKEEGADLFPESKPTVPLLPDWLPLDDWQAFVAMRKAIKKPMTQRAEELIIAKLGQMKSPPDLVLRQSITNNWQDVYELKQDTKASSPGGVQRREAFKRNVETIGGRK